MEKKNSFFTVFTLLLLFLPRQKCLISQNVFINSICQIQIKILFFITIVIQNLTQSSAVQYAFSQNTLFLSIFLPLHVLFHLSGVYILFLLLLWLLFASTPSLQLSLSPSLLYLDFLCLFFSTKYSMASPCTHHPSQHDPLMKYF